MNGAIRKLERIVLKKITHVVFDHDGTLVDTSSYERAVYPGIEDILKDLQQLGILIYVWTARSKKSAHQILTQVGLRSYIKNICGGDTARGKPSTEGLLYLLPEVSPENVVVIGDSIGDIIGAKNFGATAIGAHWAHGDNRAENMFLESGAFCNFKKTQDLKNWLINNR